MAAILQIKSLLGQIEIRSQVIQVCFVHSRYMIHNVMMYFLSAKDKGEKKLFGFAFTPLMREDGTTLSDESHELYVYKV